MTVSIVTKLLLRLVTVVGMRHREAMATTGTREVGATAIHVKLWHVHPAGVWDWEGGGRERERERESIQSTSMCSTEYQYKQSTNHTTSTHPLGNPAAWFPPPPPP